MILFPRIHEELILAKDTESDEYIGEMEKHISNRHWTVTYRGKVYENIRFISVMHAQEFIINKRLSEYED